MADLRMAFLICAGRPCPCTETRSAARPATCGLAWLVPISPTSRFPAAQGRTGAPPLVPAMYVLLHSDQTHDAKSGPHGQLETVRFSRSALPPGAATEIAERPK